MSENKNLGWISLHKKMLDWKLYRDKSTLAVFIHLLLTVNYKDGKHKNGRIIHKGCRITSQDELAEETGMGKSTIRRSLAKLQENGEISLIAIKRVGTEICVKNFNMYQNRKEFVVHNESFGEIQDAQGERQSTPINVQDERQTPQFDVHSGQSSNKTLNKSKKNNSAAYASGEFNSISNMKAIQQIECQTRWNKILKVWITTENTPALTQAYKKFEKLGTEHQEEIVQFIESIPANKRPFLKNLWISTYLKGNLFHPGIIERDLEKYVTLAPKSKDRSEEPGVILKKQPYDKFGNPI